MSDPTGEAVPNFGDAVIDPESTSCPVCDAPPFNRARDMRRHLKNVHGIEVPAPPRRPPPPRAPAAPRAAGPATPLAPRLAASVATIGFGVHMLGDDYCGAVISHNAKSWSEQAAALAAENESVRVALEAIAGGGAWGGFLFSTLGIVFACLAHHRIVPERIVPPGVIPDDLAAGRHPAANGNAANGSTPGEPTMGDDGSMTFGGVTFPPEMVAAGLEAMGIDPRLVGASEVPAHG